MSGVGNGPLRSARERAGMSREQLAASVEVDPKTVERWERDGIVPRRAGLKSSVARELGVSPEDIWPPEQRTEESPVPEQALPEIVGAWAHRADVPKGTWWALFNRAETQIDLLGYAMQFLPEDHSRLVTLLCIKAAHACRIRIALADPASALVAERDHEEGLGNTLSARIRTTLGHFKPLFDVPGAEIRMHRTPLYNSVFRADSEMIVTPHMYGLQGYRAPALHIARRMDDGIFENLAQHFERVWATTVPVGTPS